MGESFDATGHLELIGDGEWGAADLTLVAQGNKPRSFRFRPSARLRLADGQSVSLDLSRAELSDSQEVKQSGRWAELAQGPLGSAAGDYRVGPHIPLELTLRGIRNGAAVNARGVVAQRTAHGDSYREAEVELVVEVHQLTGASGSARSPEPARAPEQRFELALVGWALAFALMYSASLAAFVIALISGDVMSAVAGGGWLAYSGTLTWRVAARRWGWWHFWAAAPSYRWVPEPRSVARGEPQHRLHHGVRSYPGLSLVPFFAIVLGMGLHPLLARLSGSHEAGALLGITALVSLLLTTGLLVEDHRRTTDARRFTAALAGAARSGQWTVCQGAFAGELARRVTTRTETTGSGKARSTRVYVSETQTATDAICVDRTSVEVEGVTWAGGNLERDDPDPDRLGYRYSAGASAIVAIAGGAPSGTWKASGPESLLVFTSATDAAQVLARSLLVQRLGVVPAVLGIGLGAAIAVVIALL